MADLHPLLRRQLQRSFGPKLPEGERWASLFELIGASYDDFDSDRRLLERAIELGSSELEQANSELRGILQALPDLLVRITADNRIVGLTEASPGGLLLSLSVLEYGPSLAPGSAAASLWEAVGQVRSSRAEVHFEYAFETHSRLRYCEIRLLPFVEGDLIGILRDITASKKAEIALHKSRSDLLREKHELMDAREQLREQATHDGLTKLWNRTSILEILDRELERGLRTRHATGIALADIDHFKRVNDTYGHQVGDAVLREASGRFLAAIRPYDAVGRYGGEEFLMVFPTWSGRGDTSRIEDLRSVIADEPFLSGGQLLWMTCSFGTVFTEPGILDSQEMIRLADQALYHAKALGRNRVESLALAGAL